MFKGVEGLFVGVGFFVVVFFTEFVEHAAGTGEGCAGLDGEFVDEDVAFDDGGGMEREDFLDGDVAVNMSDDIGILADDVAFDLSVLADD